MDNKDEVYRILRNDLLSLEIKPSTRISEASIAERFNLSRTPIRDVLKKLKQENLIEIKPKSGTYVSKINMNNVEQLLFLRSCVEISSMTSLAKKDNINFDKVLYILDKQKENLMNRKLFMEYDNDFHRDLFRLDGKEMIWDIIQENNADYIRFRMLDNDGYNSARELVSSHINILDCIINKRIVELEEEIKKHLERELKRKESIINAYGDYIEL